jgi:hypothetical protein
MARFNLADISKMPAHIQAQVIAQTGAKAEVPASSPTPEAKSPPEPKERAPRPIPDLAPKASVFDSTPIYISADILGHILDSFAGAYYTAGTDTQRKAVIKHALQSLARREANPHSIP